MRSILVSRRGFLAASAVAAGTFRLNSSPACLLTAEQEEGPFYVDYKKVRTDITEGKVGVPLQLRIALVHAKLCTPLTNAVVDIWHCDASGIYSAFTGMHLGGGRGGASGEGPGHPPGPPPDGAGREGPPPGDSPFGGQSPGRHEAPFGRHEAMDSSRFLRGVQPIGSNGVAEFNTIYPGWYQGRAIHIHLKVHSGDHVAHTGQLFFPEEVTSRIAKMEPYSKHDDVHLTRHHEDDIYESEQGASGLVALTRRESKSDTAGFIATVTLAVDPDATPAPVGMHGPPPPRA